MLVLAVALGLLAAILWGLTDVLAQRATRLSGLLRTMFYSQLLGMLASGAWVLLAYDLDALAQASPLAWIAAVLAGAFGLVATACLYRALQLGDITVVAPITAGYGAVTVVLGALTRQTLNTGSATGLAACAAGAMISAYAPSQATGSTAGSSATKSILLAVAAASFYGTHFWLLGLYAAPALGPIAPFWSTTC
ncbi:EamA family transporter [Allosphingosinicella deserti]|uniref:EamA domain-containing protein n=1 Tax=Allosphingosinicella deserti TaxID=2116704 RepID=A0A2P7QZC7_9SPHN|nr:EamA family transporter [Sphingomonas deserti]PSJ43317.1 hypothetical protein C7I55_02780 [Sphingomonas deserti]